MPLGGAGEEAEVEPVARGEADRGRGGRGEVGRGRGGAERPPSVRIFHCLEKANGLKSAAREKITFEEEETLETCPSLLHSTSLSP